MNAKGNNKIQEPHMSNMSLLRKKANKF